MSILYRDVRFVLFATTSNVVLHEGKNNSIRSDGLNIGLAFHNQTRIEFIKYVTFYKGKKRSFAIVIEY